MSEGIVNTGRVARVVLLACGSFNPITNMHLRMFGRFWLRSFSLARSALSDLQKCSDRSDKSGEKECFRSLWVYVTKLRRR